MGLILDLISAYLFIWKFQKFEDFWDADIQTIKHFQLIF